MNKVAKISIVMILIIILLLAILSGGFNESFVRLVLYACIGVAFIYAFFFVVLFVRLLWKDSK